MPSILFLFVDGIGLGPDDPGTNPFAAFRLPAFEFLADGKWTLDNAHPRPSNRVFTALDATLGVEGLPQSGTGQATLLTGVNCAMKAERHYGPFPHSTSRPIIAENNLFRRLERLKGPGRTAFANAYPDRFFAYVNKTSRWTVTTLCCHEGGVPLRTYEDWIAGRALTADLTAAGWLSLGYELQPISEDEAGQRLVDLSRSFDLTLFEYFETDKAGHACSMWRAERVLRSLDTFLEGVISAMDPHRTLLVITSDHGNLEDLSTKGHTLHPVPLVAYGAGAERLAALSSIADVTPALIDLASSPVG